MQRKVDNLQQQLKQKQQECDDLKSKIQALSKSKTTLAVNADKCLSQMRNYLLEYQKAAKAEI